MPPKRACSCKTHDSSCDSPKGIVQNLETCKKFLKTVIAFLVEEGNLSPRAKLLCNNCYENACQRFAHHEADSDNVKRQKQCKYSVEEFVDLINQKTLDESTMCEIMKAAGTYLHDKLYSNVDINYAEKETLEHISYSNELSSYTNVLCDFLLALSGSTEISARILNAAEVLTHLVNSNFIGKLNFSMNLISYFITGSRTVVELRSKYSPSGSYTTLLKYLEKYSQQKKKIPNDKDILIFFDNNQVLARNWNVKYDSKALVSVVTTLISLCPPNSAQLERNPALSPLQWLHDVNVGEVSELYKVEELDNTFRMYRNKFIVELLDEIISEQKQDNGNVQDDIDKETEKTRVVKFDDNLNILYEKNETDPYSSIESQCDGKTEVTVLDPIDLNPCSYESVSKVMSHIQSESDRDWNIIGCDGLPYLLCARLIERYHTCPRCSLIFKSKPDFESHIHVNHPNAAINISACRTYGNFLLIPGLGHYEINYTKAIFQLLWTVIIIELAKMLGFRSIKALVSCEAATNHHKSWQIIQIFLKATARELLVPYVKDCIRTGIDPELKGVYTWLTQSRSKNMKFLFTCVFTYCFALDLFRKGVRRSNYHVIVMAMYKLSPLFYGLNKTQYMEIDLRHNITMQQCPDLVQQFIRHVLALSQSGHPSKCEGGDFILESKNKRMKMWLPSGAPTLERWLRVCRNLDSMDRMKENVCDGLNNDSIETGIRKTDLEREVREWRSAIRKSGYLEKEGDHTSFSGKLLDQNLIDFEKKCIENKKQFYNTFPEACKLERVFITPEDRSQANDITRKTNSEIAQYIEELLKVIPQNRQRISTFESLLTLYTWGRGFGLMPNGSALNQPNSVYGMGYYLIQSSLVFSSSSLGALLQLAFSTMSAIGCIYLGYILFFVLHDFCVVCISMYVINAVIFTCCILKYKAVTSAPAGKTPRVPQDGEKKRN